MRIALIAETCTTGVGRHVVDLLGALAARGHTVHLLHGTARADPALLERARCAPGVRVHGLPMARAPHPRDLPVLWQLARYLRREGPFDVLHGHSSKGGAYARLLAPLAGARCVYTPHALYTLAPGGGARWWLYGGIEWLLARLTHHVVCCSQDERDHALRMGLGAHRCVVVNNGIAPFAAAPTGLRARLGLAPGTLVAGFVGRLESQKAPDVMIAAMAALHRRGAAVHLVVAGDGAMLPTLRAQLDAAGAAGRVTWLGNADGRGLMPELDVLAMPSRYEGFPYVLLEALHCGVPVVATPVGGVRETLLAGQCGVVVPGEDASALADALADALASLAGDPGRRLELAARARATAVRFSVDAMTDRIEALYGAAVRARPAADRPG